MDPQNGPGSYYQQANNVSRVHSRPKLGTDNWFVLTDATWHVCRIPGVEKTIKKIPRWTMPLRRTHMTFQ